MKDLYHHLSVLCGITRNCDFRFVGNVALLPSDTVRKWHDLVRDLINYARTDNKDVLLTAQLLQAPCLFSVSCMRITIASTNIRTSTPCTY